MADTVRPATGRRYGAERVYKAWGLTPSYAFVGQPETNGVIERFFKTLKEQADYDRIFQNIEEVRIACAILSPDITPSG